MTEKCPASISGMCLQMTEGFTPCPDECERLVMENYARAARAQAPEPVRRPRKPTRSA